MKFGWDTLGHASLGGHEWAKTKVGSVKDGSWKALFALLMSTILACGDKRTEKGVRRGMLWSQLRFGRIPQMTALYVDGKQSMKSS